MVVRQHARAKSQIQRAIAAATRSDLMLRDKRGRFTGLQPAFARQVARAGQARAKAKKVRSKQNNKRERARALALLK